MIPPSVQAILDVIPDYETLVAGAIVAVFAITYRVFFNWRATPAGRALARFSLSLTAVLALIVASIFIGHDYPLRWLIRGLVYAWVIVGAANLLAALLKTWRTPLAIRIEPKRRPRVDAADHPKEHTL